MSVFIAGTGWVTPLGADVAPTWTKLCQGTEAVPGQICDELNRTPYPVFRIPDSVQKTLPQHARLRRASAISRFAAAAGLAAIEDATAGIGEIAPSRTALVFAAANGGVNYTKRFFHQIASGGAQSASPLLFPETVFNAPASHLAAILGIEGITYTVVGDGAVGLVAVTMAEDLLASETVDYCLVVAAEEADWLLCDAYHKWRLLRSAAPIEPLREPPRGTILSEGAGAVVLARAGKVRLEKTSGGRYFSLRSELPPLLQRLARDLASGDVSIIVGSANGTFIDPLEQRTVSAVFSDGAFYSPKPAFGESVGASSLWQVISAVEALTTGYLPPMLHLRSGPADPPRQVGNGAAVVLSCGLNQQIAGLRLCV